MTEQRERRPKKEDFKMLLVSGLGKDGLDMVKATVRANVSQKGNDVAVFAANANTQDRLKEAFPDAKIEVVDSDQKLFQNSFKIQSALNWKRFRNMNTDLKDTDSVLIVIHSNPYESRTPELATAFATFVAKAYTSNEEHKLKFTIRGWLKDTFMDLHEKKALKDIDGKTIEHFQFFNNRFPIVTPRDKAITAKMFLKVDEVAQIISYLSDYERAPVCVFANPAKFDERKAKFEGAVKKDRKRTNPREEKKEGDEERPKRTYEKKPYVKRDGERDGRPRDSRDGEKRPYEKRTYEKRPYEKKEGDAPRAPFIKKTPYKKQQEDIDIKVESKTKSAVIENLQAGAAVKLIPVIETRVKGAKCEEKDGKLFVRVSSDMESELRDILDAIKINKEKIQYRMK